jgi:transketolase
MPCWELFEAREQIDRDAVLPPDVPTLAVEAGVSFGWDRYADATVTLDHFGASAPGDVALRELGFTAEHVVERTRALLGG